MERQPSAAEAKAEAGRLVTIAAKLVESNDLTGAREFAILAQETDPLADGVDQILAVSDVLLAAGKDHYSVLQIDTSADTDTIRRQYRRLALLLHPDKNQSPLSESAFRHVSTAWALLSDPAKKAEYDKSIGVAGNSIYSKVDLREMEPPRHHQQDKLPVRRAEEVSSFWTACPYCYNLYEYSRVYEDCCLRCQNCHRAFHGVTISSLPPFVPGREAYYCNSSFFPLQPAVVGMGKPDPAPVNGDQGFAMSSGAIWKPASVPRPVNGQGFATSSGSGKKRGRPKKIPLGF